MSAIDILGRVARKLFGSRNERLVKRMSRTADEIDALEQQMIGLSPEALLAKTGEFKARLRNGEGVADIMPEAFAVLREASRRAQNHRHFKCQLVGGKVLHDNMVAEMRTGEGKTIVCHLSAYLKALAGKKVHIVTVNDYLVKRDAEFAMPVFALLGLTVGYIQAQQDPGGREGLRKRAYACDITYGTNSEFGFDYLRDNMKVSIDEQCQGSLDYVIVDEVDSILIDEARTPLIISGPSEDDTTRYKWADNLARYLVRKQHEADKRTLERIREWGDNPPEDYAKHPKFEDAVKRFKIDPLMVSEDEAESLGHVQYYVVQRERKSAHLTHQGVQAAQDEAKIGSFYVGANMDRPHLIEQALRAHVVYERDKDYVVQNREVIIVDEFTGRLMHGRQWSDGLHQACEAKEGVPIKEETQTLATITIQNFLKLYKERAGMTGTALTEADEFMKIYKLDVVAIPTNRPVNRLDHNDKVYRSIEQKYRSIVEEINEVHRRGRPADPFLLADVFKRLRPIMEQAGQDTSKLDEALRRFNEAEYGDEATIRFMCEVYDEAMGDELARGRPVLVGTTSVENSEKLSTLLERTYGIPHEVLNAKNHAREADIVAKAGHRHVPERGPDKRQRGNVTIATNMAGRGTDIKLEAGVVYEKCKVPFEGSGLGVPFRVQGSGVGAVSDRDSVDGEQHPDSDNRQSEIGNRQSVALPVVSNVMYPPGSTKCCIHCNEYDPATNCAHCYKPKLDPRFPAMGRNVCSINAPCGLHIVGTERHEARRIDNQLRGRSGRQGDPGSSRFFLSLEDDLLKLFMPDWMIRMMERLGLTEGTSLEDKRLNKGIERAQRKVEERNFSSRKHLLEWDEPMDFQRKGFYSARQRILEGDGLRDLIFSILDDSISDATRRYLAPDYNARCIANWCKSNLDLQIAPSKVSDEDLADVQQTIREHGKDEAREAIRTSLGEYIDPEEPASEWDLGGLLGWAQRAYKVSISQNQLRKMSPEEIEEALDQAAVKYFDEVNLDGVELFMDAAYPRRALCEWLKGKYGLEVGEDEIAGMPPAEVTEKLRTMVREAYEKREVEYPVEVCLERAIADTGGDFLAAAPLLAGWANGKFNAGWTVESVQAKTPEQVQSELLALSRDFATNGKLDAEIDAAVSGKSADEVVAWARQRFGRAWNERWWRRRISSDANGQINGSEPTPPDSLLREAVREQGRHMLRWELARLEHFVLLRIYDQAWKDHLLEMDHLKHAIMQRPMGGDQSHPQSQYAIEGRDFFDQMWERIRERVTDIIFKVKLTGAPVPTTGTSGARVMQMRHDEASSAFASAARDQQAAMRAQGQETKVVETIRREQPKVGRNDPCPCGSGKKYKQCHGKSAA